MTTTLQGFDKVQNALRTLGLQQYENNFKKHKFDFEAFKSFPTMTEAQQAKVVPDLGPRTRIINYIKENLQDKHASVFLTLFLLISLGFSFRPSGSTW